MHFSKYKYFEILTILKIVVSEDCNFPNMKSTNAASSNTA
jgi:hypothetical protein